MKTVKLTVNEIEVLKAIAATGQLENGTLYYMIEDLVRYTGKSVNSIKGTLSSLRSKNIIYCYAGECCFDGNIREDADEVVNSIINNVNHQNNKTEKDMKTENDNLVTDERIVRMNEIAAPKLSSVSRGKRENLKAAKADVKYIKESWDCPDDLKSFINDKQNEIGQHELWCIAKSRYDQLLLETAEVIVKTDEVAENNDEATSEQAAETTETPKVVENTPKKHTTKSKHEVGDLHPNGKWVWTEYAPGKFDWRTNKHDNTAVNRKERERDLGKDKPKSVKKSKQANKPVKVRTTEEILSIKPSWMSKPQERVFKLFRKGYRIEPKATTPQGYTLIKDGKTVVITEIVLFSLMSRMKVNIYDEIKLFYV